MATKTWTIDASGWVRGKLFGYTVEVRPMPRPGNAPYIPLVASVADKGNHHTTEGALPTDPNDIDDAHAWLSSIGIGCWLCGEGRIIQGRPVWAQSSCLRTPTGGPYPNAHFRIEVEQVANSKTSLWLPGEDVIGPMAAIMAFAKIEFGIQLRRGFDDWQNDKGDMPMPWAVTNNKRRIRVASVGIANVRSSWVDHCSVPYTNTHWDAGAENEDVLFGRAQALVDSLEPGGPPPPEEGPFMGLSQAQQDTIFLSDQQFGAGFNRPTGARVLKSINISAWAAWGHGNFVRTQVDAAAKLEDPPNAAEVEADEKAFDARREEAAARRLEARADAEKGAS
jgi:hypothetical protein